MQHLLLPSDQGKQFNTLEISVTTAIHVCLHDGHYEYNYTRLITTRYLLRCIITSTGDVKLQGKKQLVNSLLD